MYYMFSIHLIDPTATNLPFWSIGVLVGAVAALFSVILALMRETNKERKAVQLKLDTERKEHQDKLDTLYESNLEDQKKMAILLNDNIQLIQSLTDKK